MVQKGQMSSAVAHENFRIFCLWFFGGSLGYSISDGGKSHGLLVFLHPHIKLSLYVFFYSEIFLEQTIIYKGTEYPEVVKQIKDVYENLTVALKSIIIFASFR